MEVKTHPVSAEELMAYLDGELAAAQALEIAGHRADCVSCRALASEFERLDGRLREWTVESAPDELFQKLAQMLPSRPRASRKGFTGFGRWTLLASGGTALLVLMILASKTPSGHKMTTPMSMPSRAGC